MEEARQAADAGADAIIAQGFEAGGHVCGLTTTITLVPAIRDLLPETPLVAAGGIADGRGLAAALVLGADGVMMGTRFLASEEANTHEIYRQALLAASVSDTYYGEVFTEGWPDAPHRALMNDTIRQWLAAGAPPRGTRPEESQVLGRVNERDLRRNGDDIPMRETTGQVADLALYAGQSAGLIHRVQPASEIVASVAAEAEKQLRRLLAPTK